MTPGNTGSLSEKKYKSCHWGVTFSKGTLLYLKGAYMHGTKVVISSTTVWFWKKKLFILSIGEFIFRDITYKPLKTVLSLIKEYCLVPFFFLSDYQICFCLWLASFIAYNSLMNPFWKSLWEKNNWINTSGTILVRSICPSSFLVGDFKGGVSDI